MFEFKEVSKDFFSITLNKETAQFSLKNCNIVDPPFCHNDKWYLTIPLTPELTKNLEYVQQLSPIKCSFKNFIKPNCLLLKCKQLGKQNQFLTKFTKHSRNISYNQIYENDVVDTIVINLIGIYKNFMQFTVKEINLK
tara:strand:- start:5783 stop:6196 length:414 start_codon:yes stop_codon:yes gene_type:complete